MLNHTFVVIILASLFCAGLGESPASEAGQLITYIINECRESPSDFAEFFKENVLPVLESYDKQIDQFQKEEILRASEDLLLFLQYSDSKFRLEFSDSLSKLAFRHSLKMKIRGRTGHWFEKVNKNDVSFKAKDPAETAGSAEDSETFRTESLIFDSNDTLSQMAQKAGQVRGRVGQAVFRFPRAIDSLVYSGSLALLDWMFSSRPNRKLLLDASMGYMGVGVVEDAKFNYITFLLVEEFKEGKGGGPELGEEEQIVEALEKDRQRFAELFKESEEENQKGKESASNETESESESESEDSDFEDDKRETQKKVAEEGTETAIEEDKDKGEEEKEKTEEQGKGEGEKAEEGQEAEEKSEAQEAEGDQTESVSGEKEPQAELDSEEITRPSEPSDQEEATKKPEKKEEDSAEADVDEDASEEKTAEPEGEDEQGGDGQETKLKQNALRVSSEILTSKLAGFFREVDKLSNLETTDSSS